MKKVLIFVGDEKSLQIYTQLIAELGYEPVPVVHEKNVLPTVQSQAVDAIIIRNSAGIAVHGFDLAVLAKKRQPHAVIIVESQGEADVQRLSEHGFLHWQTPQKIIEIEDLLVALAEPA
ncbi:MAG: hypothetical protein ACKKL5_00470 [Candidatus Komeilibacteria bacterium]